VFTVYPNRGVIHTMPQETNNEVEGNTVDWIRNSPRKLEILKALEDEKRSPSELSDEFDVSLTTMSNHLTQLREGKRRIRQVNDSGYRTSKWDSSVSPVVKEITGRQRDRVYTLTLEGEAVLQEIDIS